MLKKIFRFIEVLAVLILTVVLIKYCTWIARPVNTDGDVAAIKAFYKQPINSIDVIGYGSSHLWRGFVPEVLKEKYGLTAFNYGGNWQHINTTKLFFKDSLLTQAPKVAVIETYRVNELLQDEDLNGEIYYTRYLTNTSIKKEYLKQCFGNDMHRYLAYYFPLSAFHENWKDITMKNFIPISDMVRRYQDSMGFSSHTESVEIDLTKTENHKEQELCKEALRELDQIVETCREKNIELVFYTAPYQGDYEYGDAMARYAEEHHCHYINMFRLIEEIGIDGKSDFYDKGHLNETGARKVTDFLGNYIVNNVLPAG